MRNLPDVKIEKLKKVNRIKKLSPKLHKIEHESGRSTKSLWQRIGRKGRSVGSSN